MLLKKIDKKYLSYFSAFFVFAFVLFVYVNGNKNAETVSTFAMDNDYSKINYNSSAKACVLMDAYSGQILHYENMHARLPMASTTKIMTALVIIEDMPFDSTVTVEKECCGVEGSSIYLQQGEQLSVKELLYGLLLESGNDAACTLATAHSGSIEKFADAMNLRAQKMGLKNTHFDNPHGLSSNNHYTSAYDLAVITQHALKNQKFSEIVATKKYYIAERENCKARYFTNHNKLIFRMDICDGVKTGYTIASGRCLVSSVSADNSRFIVVTLNDRNDYADHKYLLEYAVNEFNSVKLFDKGDLKYVLPHLKPGVNARCVENIDDAYITLKKSEDAVVDIKITIKTESFENENVKANCIIKLHDNDKCFNVDFNQYVIYNSIP